MSGKLDNWCVGSHPIIIYFLGATSKLNPRIKSPIPPWDFNLVLNALMDPLLEHWRRLSDIRVIFLAAVCPVWRIGECRHFLRRDSFLAFHHDKLAKATPYLLLKAVFQFPLNHEGNLPNPFCSSSSKKKKECHHLNLERTNKVFIKQKVDFRKKPR